MAVFKTKHEKKALIITVVLNVLLILILFFFGLTYLDPPPENGIAINFGTSVGSGEKSNQPVKTAPKQAATAPPKAQEKAVSEPNEIKEEVITQDKEEAPVIEPEKQPKKPEKKVEPEDIKEKQKPVKTEEKPEEIKKPDPKPEKSTSDALNSILNGPEKKGKEKGGEGNDDQAGNKGDPNGDPKASSYYGRGKGTDGDGNYRLGGRKALNKEKFVQDCNEAGTVVVRIEVNQQGKVIRANAGVKGTTNTAACLLEPAKRAALATKFNSDSNAPSKQVGTIIYEFKLSE